MNNPSGASDVALTVFGGVCPEMDANDLPEGVSAGNQDVDFSPGTVFTRGGRLNQVAYANSFFQRLAGLGQSVGTAAQAPWLNPNNITLNAPPAYASVTLGPVSSGSTSGTIVQTFSVNVTNATTMSVSPSKPLSVGNVLVLFLKTNPPDLSGLGCISDTLGHTFSRVASVGGVTSDFDAYTALIVNGGSDTINVNPLNGGSLPQLETDMNLIGCEILGVLKNTDGAPLGQLQNTGTTFQTRALTTTVANDLIVEFAGIDGAATPATTDAFTPAVSNQGLSIAILPVITTGTYQGNWSKPGAGFVSTVILALPIVTGVGAFDTSATGATGVGATSTAVSTGTATPTSSPEWALDVSAGSTNTPATDQITTPNPPWTIPSLSDASSYQQQVVTTPVAFTGTMPTIGGLSPFWASAMTLFKVIGGNAPPKIVQSLVITSGGLAAGTYASAFASPPRQGNTIMAVVRGSLSFAGQSVSSSDTVNGAYTSWASVESGGVTGGGLAGNGFAFISMSGVQNIATGNPTVSVTLAQGLSGSIQIIEVLAIPGSGSGGSGFSISQELQATNFAFSIPTTASIMGFQVLVTGHQTNLSPDAILTLSLISPSATSPTFQFQLPSSDGTVTLGTPTSNWGLSLTPALLNNPSFGVQIQASEVGTETVTFDVSAVQIKVWVNLNPANVNWIKTYEQTDGEIDTLALDATGVLWDEDVINNPGIFNAIFTAIESNTYAKSVTFDDVEYIAFSDLSNGTDVPRLWNGQWLDRVSQVGPGAPPSVATTASGSAITSITQNAPITLLTGAHDFLLVSAAPSAHGTFGTPSTPGNVMTIVPRAAFIGPAYIKVGSNIQISGFPSINGNNVNNDPAGVTNPAYYTVTSVGQPIPGQASYDWITFQVPFTTFYNQPTPGGCQIRATIATLTAAQQVPFLEVGNQFTVTGASLAGYNNTFVVQATPNASQLSISQTSLTGNVAQYVFTLITGSLPVVGQFVTVTGTLNGNGAFNVTNAAITAATPTTFSISLVSANIAASAETGNGIISGTIFQFDPVGVVTNPIIGNSVGGTIATSGVLGVGTRQCVCIFQTRNGALTAPSPFVQFNITASASAIVVSQIPIGPPNVSARILAFTGANGGNFFYIPIPVTVTSNGQQITYSSTVLNDNTTTQVTLSFPDAVLLAATAIDVQGNNLFEQIELGSSVGFLSYADRLIAWGEQNKVQNLQNLSFDGGVGIQSTGIITTYPLGWTVDPTFGGGSSVIVSPIFGNSFYIKNTTGGLQATYGMIEQGAFQDQFQVPIITSNTLYSVRVTARCPSQIGSGNLVMDLFSPKLNQVFGSFSVPLASMGTTMQIFSGTLLTSIFQTVPNDLLFRVYVTALPNNGDVELDRVEPFPTLEPVFSTQFRGSYAFNPEAFDLVTGGFGPSQNQQPIRGGMVLFDTLYALKTNSWYSTSDNGTTEPFKWNWREVSNKVGTIGSHSFDYGEDWAFSACRSGVYFFSGGEPLKVSQEIQPVWDAINWSAGQSIWLRNDSAERKLYVGVPISTPNEFMPEFPISTNPTTPNVVLVMNYRELNSGMAVADTPPIRSSLSGRLIAPEPARKWTYWNIKSPYADFIDRGNNQTPLWLCSGYNNSKIFALDPNELDDDGLPINSWYLTYGAIKSDMKDAKGMGLHRLEMIYLTLLAEGAGNIQPYIYPQNPANLPFTLATAPLAKFSLGDIEYPINVKGERFFLRFGTNDVGAKFQMSEVVFSLMKDAWSAIRGTQVGSQ